MYRPQFFGVSFLEILNITKNLSFQAIIFKFSGHIFFFKKKVFIFKIFEVQSNVFRIVERLDCESLKKIAEKCRR